MPRDDSKPVPLIITAPMAMGAWVLGAAGRVGMIISRALSWASVEAGKASRILLSASQGLSWAAGRMRKQPDPFDPAID